MQLCRRHRAAERLCRPWHANKVTGRPARVSLLLLRGGENIWGRRPLRPAPPLRQLIRRRRSGSFRTTKAADSLTFGPSMDRTGGCLHQSPVLVVISTKLLVGHDRPAGLVNATPNRRTRGRSPHEACLPQLRRSWQLMQATRGSFHFQVLVLDAGGHGLKGHRRPDYPIFKVSCVMSSRHPRYTEPPLLILDNHLISFSILDG